MKVMLKSVSDTRDGNLSFEWKLWNSLVSERKRVSEKGERKSEREVVSLEEFLEEGLQEEL